MAHTGSTDTDLPEEELPGAESKTLECDGQARPDSRLYKKVLALNAFIDESAKGLSPSAALVWLTLFRFARDGVALVSKATVGARIGLSERMVGRHVKTLIRHGLVKLDRHGGASRRCNRYRLGVKQLGPHSAKPSKARQKSPPPESGSLKDNIADDPALYVGLPDPTVAEPKEGDVGPSITGPL
jgi:DNA-binding MarR family transcriptional regulator